MNPICFHAKKVNKRFMALVDFIKSDQVDQDLALEAKEILANQPKTHTFCIKNEKDCMLVTWSKVWKAVDTFSKKEGNEVAINKMMVLSIKYDDNKKYATEHNNIEEKISAIKKLLYDHLPAAVASTVPWYIKRAINYYQINENKEVIIEGSIFQKGNHGTRKPVLLSVKSNDLLLLL